MLRCSVALAFGLAASKPASRSRRICDQGKVSERPHRGRVGERPQPSLNFEPESGQPQHKSGRVSK